jgi:predicted nucleic acid-binding protein
VDVINAYLNRLNKGNNELVEEAIKRKVGICRDLYHGTSIYNAQKILKTKIFEIPKKPGGYLGRGVYCYLHDAEASRIYARKKTTGKIAVVKLVANLDNTFFVCKELYNFFYRIAQKHKEIELATKEKVGYIIEKFIEQVIIPDYDVNISTVSQSYMLDRRRCVTMYCLRNNQMINIPNKLYWEEK